MSPQDAKAKEKLAKATFSKEASAILCANFLRALDLDGFERHAPSLALVARWRREGVPWNVNNYEHQQKVLRWVTDGSINGDA